MGSFIRNLGSLVRMESSYSNEQDPWENDVPMSFQSTRRESRAKPPGSVRNPRAFTLPNLLSLRSHMRNRSNDSEYIPYSPALSRAPPLSSPRSIAARRERVVDDHNATEEISPAIMARSFIRPSNGTTGQPVDARGEINEMNENATGAQNIRNEENGNGFGRRGGNKRKGKSEELRDMPPTSPVSDEVGEQERSSRRNWIRGRVLRALRFGRRERPDVQTLHCKVMT